MPPHPFPRLSSVALPLPLPLPLPAPFFRPPSPSRAVTENGSVKRSRTLADTVSKTVASMAWLEDRGARKGDLSVPDKLNGTQSNWERMD
ncbi:MAG: hypothetical protein LBQ12_08685 [Deltaproteobacteria bacterium]|nr:hypothetical protein [Deltaproteobacteria bacterium]